MPGARVETLIKNALHASGDFTRVSCRLVCKLRVYINESKYMRETESGYCTPAIHRGCPLQFRVASATGKYRPKTQQILNTIARNIRPHFCIFRNPHDTYNNICSVYTYSVEHNAKRYKNFLKQTSRRYFSLFHIKRDMRSMQRLGNIESYYTSISVFSQILKFSLF